MRLIVAAAVLCAFVAAKPHRKHDPPPCGLPAYTDGLPEDAKKKVEEIWKDYKDGDKCYEEQGLTREVIDSLPRGTRRKLFKGAFLPPFLRKASADVKEQFSAVFRDRSIPFEDKPKKLREIAEKTLKDKDLEEFNKFVERMEQHRADFKEKVDKLSKNARAAWDKIEKLEKEKHDIFHKLDEDVRDELFELFHQRRGHGVPQGVPL